MDEFDITPDQKKSLTIVRDSNSTVYERIVYSHLLIKEIRLETYQDEGISEDSLYYLPYWRLSLKSSANREKIDALNREVEESIGEQKNLQVLSSWRLYDPIIQDLWGAKFIKEQKTNGVQSALDLLYQGDFKSEKELVMLGELINSIPSKSERVETWKDFFNQLEDGRWFEKDKYPEFIKMCIEYSCQEIADKDDILNTACLKAIFDLGLDEKYLVVRSSIEMICIQALLIQGRKDQYDYWLPIILKKYSGYKDLSGPNWVGFNDNIIAYYEPNLRFAHRLRLIDFEKNRGNYQKIVDTYNLLCWNSRNAKNYDLAIKYGLLALDAVKLKSDYNSTKDTVYHEKWIRQYIASSYQRSGDYSNAIKWNKENLERGDFYNDPDTKTMALQGLGFAYLDKNQTDSAISHFESGIELRLEYDLQYALAWPYNGMTRAYLAKEDFDSSKKYMRLALEAARLSDREDDREKAYYAAWQHFDKTNQLDSAYKYKLLHDESSKIMGGREKSSGLVTASLTEEESRKKKQIREIAAKQEAEAQHEIELEKSRKQLIAWSGGIGGVFLIGFLLFVFNRLRHSRRQNIIIEEQKAEVEEKHTEIQDSIAYAKRIQSAILPPLRLVEEHLPNSFILYKPKDVVAGDFYWMETKEDKVLIAAADCTGHGVPGAMVSVICNGGLNRSVNEFGITEPGQILDKTRELVIQEFEKSEEEVKDGMDIALCALTAGPSSPINPDAEAEQSEETRSARIDSSGSATLQYAGAHNALWIVRKGAEEVEEIKADKQPIGKYAEEKPFTTHTVELNEGDTFYLFSDGYADQFGGERGKKFKAANFKRLLISIQDKSMDDQKSAIDKAFEDWRGDQEQVDDVCVIGVRV